MHGCQERAAVSFTGKQGTLVSSIAGPGEYNARRDADAAQ